MTPEQRAHIKRELSKHDRNEIPSRGAPMEPWGYVAMLFSELEAAEAVAREMVEAQKTALCVMSHWPRENLDGNFQRDIDCALEGVRSSLARAEALGVK